MSPLLRLLGLANLRALSLVHLGALGLLALAAAVEAANGRGDQLYERLSVEVPRTWALLSPALAAVAGAVATHRLRERRELLALQTLGTSRSSVLVAAPLSALPAAAFAVAVGRLTDPQAEILRGAGGWWVRGVALPDPGGASVAPVLTAALPPAWLGSAALALGAAALGARLGARGAASSVVLLSVTVLVGDLLRRGSDAPFALAAAGAAVLLALGLSERA